MSAERAGAVLEPTSTHGEMATIDNCQSRFLILTYHTQTSLYLRHRPSGDSLCFPLIRPLLTVYWRCRRFTGFVSVCSGGFAFFFYTLSFEAFPFVTYQFVDTVDEFLPD